MEETLSFSSIMLSYDKFGKNAELEKPIIFQYMNPGFSSIQKLVDHTLGHKILRFQADHTL